MTINNLISTDKQRLSEVIEDAQMAFWAVVADKYPEITTGDFSPQDSIELDDALTKAVISWLDGNQV